MTSAKKTIAHAEQQCLSNGTKMTRKRQAVLTGLLKSKQAMTAYELSDFCKQELGESMPTMSVYRILEFLESQQLVHKLKLANRFVACIHIACDHQHAAPQFLICINCYKVAEVSIKESTINALRNSVDSAGYTLVSPQIELSCLCEDCAATEES